MIKRVINRAAIVAALLLFGFSVLLSTMSYADIEEGQIDFHPFNIHCESNARSVRFKVSLRSTDNVEQVDSHFQFMVVTHSGSKINYSITELTQVSIALDKNQFPVSIVNHSNSEDIAISERCSLISD